MKKESIFKTKRPDKNKSGIYYFLDAKDNIIYIGSSKNLYERMRAYDRNKDLKHSLIKRDTKDIHFEYTEDYKAKEKQLIEFNTPKYNIKMKKAPVQPWIPRHPKYIDFYLIKKLYKLGCEIVLAPTKKGTGKTTTAIRNMLNDFKKNGKPSYYIRTTNEQIEEFVADGKFEGLLTKIGFPITSQHKITTKGLFVYEKDGKRKRLKPIIYFLNINAAMKVQSSAFAEANWVVPDEIQNHFLKSSNSVFRKFLNLMSSALRESNPKILILFNKVDNNDLFLQKFKLEKQLEKMPKGTIRKFSRFVGKDDWGNNLYIKFGIFNPPRNELLEQSLTNSIAYKLSFLDEYGAVMNSDGFYMELSDVKFIERYGDFEGIINFDGNKLGLWIDKQGGFQLSSKYNSNGKMYYLNIGEYSKSANLIREDFLLKLKNQMLEKRATFEDTFIFGLVVKMLEHINLYKNK